MFACTAAGAELWVAWVIAVRTGGSAERSRPLTHLGLQKRSPAVADIIGACLVWTVAMISSGSIPCK